LIESFIYIECSIRITLYSVRLQKMKAIQIYPKEEEKKLIQQACEQVGLKVAPFIRSCAVKEARSILKQKEAVSNGN
jgi:uncharacterized protein (DUF1778 family)